MRVAIETILWKHRPDSVEQMLRDVKAAGYEGVEFWQHPEILGPAKEVYELLRELRLCFVGMAGGSLEEKIEYVRKVAEAENLAVARGGDTGHRVACFPGGKKPHIWVLAWDGQRSQAVLDAGLTLALLPHMFTPVQTAQEAESLLREHPRLRFLPDTGHLTVAGEDVVQVLERNFTRIEAVHVKDWTAEFGRAYQFYARGFTELGKGDVDVDGCVDLLKSQRFPGWLIVDQSFSHEPAASAARSRDWLRQRHGI